MNFRSRGTFREQLKLFALIFVALSASSIFGEKYSEINDSSHNSTSRLYDTVLAKVESISSEKSNEDILIPKITVLDLNSDGNMKTRDLRLCEITQYDRLAPNSSEMVLKVWSTNQTMNLLKQAYQDNKLLKIRYEVFEKCIVSVKFSEAPKYN